MKKLIFSFSIFLLSLPSFSQNKPSIKAYAGFGIQQYNGDLGNGFYDFSLTTYGVASLGIDIRLNKSFDVKIFTTVGDLGYCQPKDKHTHEEEHEHEHGKNPEDENLNSRMASGIIALQYNFANGYLLPEHSKLAPYFYIGVGTNRITDIMEMECVVPGQYSTLNWGLGFEHKLSKNWYATVSLSYGRFSSDNIDFIKKGSKDLYHQNSLLIAYQF